MRMSVRKAGPFGTKYCPHERVKLLPSFVCGFPKIHHPCPIFLIDTAKSYRNSDQVNVLRVEGDYAIAINRNNFISYNFVAIFIKLNCDYALV